MFPQNLLKKISELIEEFERQLRDNYLEIVRNILVVGGVGIFFIILVVLLLTRLSSPGNHNQKVDKNVNTSQKNDVSKIKLLVSNEFEYPDVKLFDLTSDYVDFVPTRKYYVPDFKQSVNDYDAILEEGIKDSLKFNFEK